MQNSPCAVTTGEVSLRVLQPRCDTSSCLSNRPVHDLQIPNCWGTLPLTGWSYQLLSFFLEAFFGMLQKLVFFFKHLMSTSFPKLIYSVLSPPGYPLIHCTMETCSFCQKPQHNLGLEALGTIAHAMQVSIITALAVDVLLSNAILTTTLVKQPNNTSHRMETSS